MNLVDFSKQSVPRVGEGQFIQLSRGKSLLGRSRLDKRQTMGRLAGSLKVGSQWEIESLGRSTG